MDTLSTFNFILSTQTGVTCGPRYPLILHEALATGPVSAAIANANATPAQ